jgi:hypothetical protein
MGRGRAYRPPLFFKIQIVKKTVSAKNLKKLFSLLIDLFFVNCASIFIKTISFTRKMHLKRPIQKVGVQKAAAIFNAGWSYTYFKIT